MKLRFPTAILAALALVAGLTAPVSAEETTVPTRVTNLSVPAKVPVHFAAPAEIVQDITAKPAPAPVDTGTQDADFSTLAAAVAAQSATIDDEELNCIAIGVYYEIKGRAPYRAARCRRCHSQPCDLGPLPDLGLCGPDPAGPVFVREGWSPARRRYQPAGVEDGRRHCPHRPAGPLGQPGRGCAVLSRPPRQPQLGKDPRRIARQPHLLPLNLRSEPADAFRGLMPTRDVLCAHGRTGTEPLPMFA